MVGVNGDRGGMALVTTRLDVEHPQRRGELEVIKVVVDVYAEAIEDLTQL